MCVRATRILRKVFTQRHLPVETVVNGNIFMVRQMSEISSYFLEFGSELVHSGQEYDNRRFLKPGQVDDFLEKSEAFD
jgi:hypothetical protein